jgi:hypothetical protein
LSAAENTDFPSLGQGRNSRFENYFPQGHFFPKINLEIGGSGGLGKQTPAKRPDSQLARPNFAPSTAFRKPTPGKMMPGTIIDAGEKNL